MLRHYETVFVLHPEMEEEKKEKLLEGLKRVVKKFKGEIKSIDEWGKKRLAYPIRKLKEGYYILINYSLFSEGLKELERRLKLNEQVIRFQTVKIDAPTAPDSIKGGDEGAVEKGDNSVKKEETH